MAPAAILGHGTRSIAACGGTCCPEVGCVIGDDRADLRRRGLDTYVALPQHVACVMGFHMWEFLGESADSLTGLHLARPEAGVYNVSSLGRS